MDDFDTYRSQLFELISESCTKNLTTTLDVDEHENIINNYLNEKINECRNEKIIYPDSLSFFDLIEGEVYYLLSGLSHFSFKIMKKIPSQYNGLPFYEIKDTFSLDKNDEKTRHFSNGMIFCRYKHVINSEL